MRRSGILLHISSLPSPYGIGKLGQSARAFVNFLAESGTQVWQVLPLAPTSFGDSPYQSFSVFAGNPYFVDFETLEAQHLLQPEEYKSVDWGSNPRKVDYNRLYNSCFQVLRKAFARFDTSSPKYQKFCTDQQEWLDDYALFMALKDAHNGDAWYLWEKPLAMREPDAMRLAKEKFARDINFYKVVQFWFWEQWMDLRAYCKKKDVSLIGDIPIYAAYDSADVWANPDLFLLDEEEHKPKVVAGCPPDGFAPTGQLWGNPLYDWDAHKKTGYAWWIRRFKQAMTYYDTIRVDHFRGFESYYAIPYGNKTAEIGLWEPGPGMDLFNAVREKLGNLSLIAEDLGFVTPEVRQLLKDTGYPGMKVLQFAFDGNPKNEYLPQNYTSPHCIAYTGTHDNTTLRGWVAESDSVTLSFAKRYLHCRSNHDLPSEVIRAAWSSIAELSIAQMQDFLDVGAEGRMNTPSTLGNNWQYRTINSDFTPRLSKRIYRMNELYNRLPEPSKQTTRLTRAPKIKVRSDEEGVHTKVTVVREEGNATATPVESAAPTEPTPSAKGEKV